MCLTLITLYEKSTSKDIFHSIKMFVFYKLLLFVIYFLARLPKSVLRLLYQRVCTEKSYYIVILFVWNISNIFIYYSYNIFVNYICIYVTDLFSKTILNENYFSWSVCFIFLLLKKYLFDFLDVYLEITQGCT